MVGNPDIRARDKHVTRAIHRFMWQATLQDKKHLLGSLAFRLPANFVADILTPLYVALALEAVVNRDFDAVYGYSLSIIGFGLLYGLLWGIGGFWVIKNAVVAAQYVQKQIFENFLNKDYEFYSNSYVGALGAQAAQLREALNGYNQVFILYGPRLAIIVVFSIAVIALQSLALAVVTFLCMSVVLSYTLASSRWRLRFRRKLSEQSSHLAGIIGDALGQGTTVKSFAMEEYESKKLDKALKPWATAQYKAWLTSIPADLGRVLLAAITIAILLLFTSHLYQRNEIDLAIVLLVQLYVVKMIVATHDIAALIKDYESTMGSVYQSVKTMLALPVIKDSAAPKRIPRHGAYDIKFKNVSFRYEDAKANVQAVQNFNLVLKQGERVGLVGYSGSGKSTLTKLLVRFMDVTEGEITINGVNIQEASQKSVRSIISYVPQEPLLFHRSILENISYGKPSASRKDVEKVAHAAFVHEFVGQLPHGYDTIVGEQGVKLSGGQRQRVAIARALLKDAPVIVLDEATSALDSRSEKLVQEALWKLMKGRSALVIAHRLSTIQRMDRIIVMDKGKIVQTGTHNKLKQAPGIYANLWKHQSGGYIGVPAVDE